MKVKVIDGSMGEGGGQVLRTAVALSAVTGTPVKIVNIRAKRRNPGLQRQHLTSVKAAATLSNARVEGLRLGSTTIEFYPRELRGGSYKFDIGTAGSVTLVLQTILPILPYVPEPVEVTVVGGTDVPWSPTIDYVRGVLTPIISMLGLNLEVTLIKRGHYPRGGGLVRYKVDNPPGSLKPVTLEERGDIKFILGVSHATKLPSHVAERQARSAISALKEEFKDVKISIDVERDPEGTRGVGPGSGIAVWAVCEKSILGSDSLGERGKPAEKVGSEAALKLIEDLRTKAALDRHMSDMIIPLIALARGESIVCGSRLTLHAKTNLMVVKEILEDIKYRVNVNEDESFKLEIKGVSL